VDRLGRRGGRRRSGLITIIAAIAAIAIVSTIDIIDIAIVKGIVVRTALRREVGGGLAFHQWMATVSKKRTLVILVATE
jgi:hypothetical protein